MEKNIIQAIKVTFIAGGFHKIGAKNGSKLLLINHIHKFHMR